MIHGRTLKQGFGGQADYELIKKIKKTAGIPIIVSGDIDMPLKAKQVLGLKTEGRLPASVSFAHASKNSLKVMGLIHSNVTLPTGNESEFP
ncbi:MAG: hypothetical protein FJW56_01415 [Actinobacteria bacterium]|nr:hypothetical protein [Actinomycetota bacterium]